MSAASRELPPLPDPDETTRPFWEGAARGELVIQRCRKSGRWIHPPQRVCACCGDSQLGFERASGRGTIYSFSVMRDQRVQGFADRVPYLNAWVELDEQPLLILVCNLVGAEPDAVAIGRRVEVVFEKLTDDVTLPQFRLAD